MTDKEICKNRGDEIKSLRKRSHNTQNRVTILEALHEENTRDIGDIKVDIRAIKENHLFHIERDVKNTRERMTSLETNVTWLTKFFWIIAAASIGSFVTVLYDIIF